jgi:hypothetical protein
VTAPVPRSHVLLVAATLLTAGLAGCLGSSTAEFGSFDEARDQVHTVHDPVEGTGLQLGLLEPTPTEDVAQGKHNVTFLVWNEDEEPVEGAEVTLDAFMPMMGHGTSPEEDPEHLENGVYRGSTNLMMGGDWLLFVNATLPSGEDVRFELTLTAAGDGGHGDGHAGHGDKQTRYGSYQEARDADGETFAPEQNSSIRLKLLDPDTENVDQGETNVTVLFYDEDADEPVTEGQASLNATMPAMGHGTSPEEDPVHVEHGVWKGLTTFSMNGTWILDVDLAHNDTLSWAINVTVGDGGMDDMDGEDEDDEPAFEPYTVAFEDEVTEPDYQERYPFDVEGANATLQMNGTLDNATMVTDELDVELLDDEDSSLGSFTLDADTNESSLIVDEAPNQGEYAVNVTGQAVDADYRVTVHVTPP